MRIINIFTNDTAISKQTGKLLKQKLEKSGFVVPKGFDEKAELIVCIGGDGSFLKTLHQFDFPDVPFIGVNTGHLGFFQELHPDELDELIFRYKNDKYTLQELQTVEAVGINNGKETVYRGLNEIVVKGVTSHIIHLNIFIGDSFIQRFSGDGILVATASGSTAYNYSLGGSIVDPRLDLLQVTPIAPMNTTAYRSFTSSIILPPDLSLKIYPESVEGSGIILTTDGMEFLQKDIQEIIVKFSQTKVKLLRFENYDFWNKVKSKFL